ncbi:MAG: 1,4-alpha-glucan branching protein, partial [Ferruginibacter sp.]
MDKPTVPTFLSNSNIYEVNLRQYSPEGTIRAFMQHLPRLKDMGAEILWMMPIHPIGDVKRKGSLGSYYSIKDFRDVNP